MNAYMFNISGFEDFEAGLATTRSAKQIYASQTKVKPLVDANFWNIFSDRNKLIIVAFWADSCSACAESASVMTSMANRFFKGPAGPVKFYQVQWDPKVNPRVHQSFGFKSVPVVFFYYTSTGRPPSKAAPLLEGSLGHDDQHEPNRFVQTIEAILRRRHVPVSKTRGWKHSRELITKSDFTAIDRILIQQSPFQRYFVNLYRANPTIRFSNRAQIHTRSTFNSVYQAIYGQLPGSDVGGALDKRNQRPHLVAVNNFLQTYLGSAIHEAVHLYCCPVIGANTTLHAVYGFGIAEGFTQYITQEILKSQGLAIVQPSPYKQELALANSLIKALGLRAVADDYFTCVRVHRIQNYVELFRLNHEAAAQRARGSERGLSEVYEKIKRFLDAIRPRP